VEPRGFPADFPSIWTKLQPISSQSHQHHNAPPQHPAVQPHEKEPTRSKASLDVADVADGVADRAVEGAVARLERCARDEFGRAVATDVHTDCADTISKKVRDLEIEIGYI